MAGHNDKKAPEQEDVCHLAMLFCKAIIMEGYKEQQEECSEAENVEFIVSKKREGNDQVEHHEHGRRRLFLDINCIEKIQSSQAEHVIKEFTNKKEDKIGLDAAQRDHIVTNLSYLYLLVIDDKIGEYLCQECQADNKKAACKMKIIPVLAHDKIISQAEYGYQKQDTHTDKVNDNVLTIKPLRIIHYFKHMKRNGFSFKKLVKHCYRRIS